MIKKSNTKATHKSKNKIQNEEIIYPINFDFKALMDATIEDDENKQQLVDVFNKNSIEYLYHDKKISSKGTYVSFTYKVTIINKEVMANLYNDLKSVKGLKFAL